MGSDTQLQAMCDRGDYKDAIQEMQRQIALTPRSDLYLSLAALYVRDQQEELGLASFAKALKTAKPVKKVPTQAERTLFDELLPVYLHPKDGKESLEERLTPILRDHPDYLYMQFFAATLSANKKKFEEFFSYFYRSYLSYPDCYMAYKSQGVLASLLLQRVREVHEKEFWRREALSYFRLACKEMPQDIGLYKMLICTAGAQEKKETVSFCLEAIIAADAVVPRGEIPFYIQEALQVQDKALAEKLLKKATSWYQYSRIIQDLQRQIDEH
ncbi:MAG: hypothetical protein JSR46_08030 [Verrucomicrobia bacterium]|nr:hypothetical protein [Verrucomicrobiota bacterium]